VSRYTRASVSQSEHDFYQWLATECADKSARALAINEMRLGNAHKYLIAAHLQALMDGAGEDAAFAFIDELIADIERTPSEALQVERDDIGFRKQLARNLGKSVTRATRG